MKDIVNSAVVENVRSNNIATYSSERSGDEPNQEGRRQSSSPPPQLMIPPECFTSLRSQPT